MNHKKMKNGIKATLAPLFNKLGFVRKDQASKKATRPKSQPTSGKLDLMSTLFQTMKDIGFIPNHIVDVGAHKGGWTRQALRFFPDAYYTLFEPNPRLRASIQNLLQNPKITCHDVGVGKEAGQFRFTLVDRDDSCSFIYSEEEANALGFEQVNVPVVTLNEFFVNSQKPRPDVIKIDAEGVDLDVLEGAASLLGATEIVFVEAAVVSRSFANDVRTVINSMNDYGHTLFDITDLNRPFDTKVLWLVELAFVLRGGKVDSQIDSLLSAGRATKSVVA